MFCLQIRYLGCIGGKNLADTTRRVMKQVFDIPLARQLNFAGRGEKTGIGAMAVTTVIIREWITSEFYRASKSSKCCSFYHQNFIKSLYWLEINQRIQHKISSLAHKTLHSGHPFLRSLLHLKHSRSTHSWFLITIPTSLVSKSYCTFYFVRSC